VIDRYLRAAAEAVFAQGGTALSYRGDGLLAVFGSPEPMHDHADRALAAARDLLTRVAALAHDGAPAFEVGVALHSGELVAGTVGAAPRLEFLVAGDVVNTTFRLEGETKRLGTRLIVSDATHALLSAPAEDLAGAGELVLRGRSTPVSAWKLV